MSDLSNLRFSETHEWVKLEGEVATVGISHYAQMHLGDIVFVELPKIGFKVSQQSQFGTIESTKAASELYSPLGGEVIEINSQLQDNPQWVNEDPYGKGWMIKIRIEDSSQINNLMDDASYKEFLVKESH